VNKTQREKLAETTWRDLSEKLWLSRHVRLRRHSEYHYSIRTFDGEAILWCLNIYPTTCRLYWDKKYPKHPFVKVSHPWSLATVVEGLLRVLPQRKEIVHGNG
jgi:hypothetical protein